MVPPVTEAQRQAAWYEDEEDRPGPEEFARSVERQKEKEAEVIDRAREESERIRSNRAEAEKKKQSRPVLEIGKTKAESAGQSVDMPFRDIIDQEERERQQAYFEGLDESGRIIPPEEYAHRDKGESQLELMGHRVAERMERLRRPGYHTGEDTFFVGACSMSEKEIPKFWRSNANPYVQRQKRRPIFKALSFYMQERSDAGSAFRMWVIHDGPRCHSLHLPERWSAQARKVSDWNESAIAKRLGVNVIFRSAEAGSPLKKESEKRWNAESERFERQYIRDSEGNRIRCTDSDGCQTWHPHSHLIVELTRWLSDSEWSELIETAQGHFGTPKLDAGHVSDPREACKYVLKCDELNDVRDIDFLRFLKWTYKRRLVSFYGDAKSEKSRIERDGLRIKSEWDAKTQRSKYVERKSHHVEVVKKDMPKQWTPPKKDSYCALVAKLDPIPFFSPVAEPVFLVRGHVDWTALYSRPDVQAVISRAQEPYDAAHQAFPMIYGVTVEEFMQGAPAYEEEPQKAELGFEWTEFRAVSLGSAHTPPVISESPSPSQPGVAGRREIRAASEEPVGRPQAVSSNQTSQLFPDEPPG